MLRVLLLVAAGLAAVAAAYLTLAPSGERNLASPSPAVIALAEDRHAASRLLDVEGGINDFVGKPFDPAELKARVRAALRPSS